MAERKEYEAVYIKIHGMSCINRCRHCYYFGAPGKTMMDYEQINFVLEKASELREGASLVMPQYFDEPTIHPDFPRIFERQSINMV